MVNFLTRDVSFNLPVMNYYTREKEICNAASPCLYLKSEKMSGSCLYSKESSCSVDFILEYFLINHQKRLWIEGQGGVYKI